VTKLRRPLSEHEAVRTIIEMLGLPEAARQAARHPRTVNSWSEADRAARAGAMPFGAALRLDRAYVAAGGAAPPIGCFYMTELRASCAASFYTAAAHAELAARAAIEAGQATAACLIAYSGSRNARALLDAERETEQAITALGTELFDIRRQLVAEGVERSW